MLCKMLKSSNIHFTLDLMYCSFEVYAIISIIPLLQYQISILAQQNRKIVVLQDYKSSVASKSVR